MNTNLTRSTLKKCLPKLRTSETVEAASVTSPKSTASSHSLTSSSKSSLNDMFHQIVLAAVSPLTRKRSFHFLGKFEIPNWETWPNLIWAGLPVSTRHQVSLNCLFVLIEAHLIRLSFGCHVQTPYVRWIARFFADFSLVTFLSLPMFL